MNLYDINQEFRSLCDIEDAVTDEDADALLALFSEVQARFDDKVAAVSAYILNLESKADMFDVEARKLANRKAILERRAERLREYLSNAMKANGSIESKSGLFIAKFVKNPWAVEISPNAKIPAEYLKTAPPPEPTPDKQLIAEALKGGKEIDGVRLVQSVRLKISLQ